MKAHPASRLLLLYAAALAIMLVAAVTSASMRDAAPAAADADTAKQQLTQKPR